MESTSTRPESAPGRVPASESALDAQPPLAVLLREGFRWFMDRLNEDADSVGDLRLSGAAAVVVSYLRPGGSRPADIARSMGVSRQHVHTVVRELVDAGFVRVVPDPDSRRDRLIVATPDGEARRVRATARLASLEAELSDRIGEAELRRLRDTLDRLWNPHPNRRAALGVERAETPAP